MVQQYNNAPGRYELVHLFAYGCYCCIELIVLSGYIYQCFRFVLPLPDRNRRVPVRNIPFSISRNTGFVFPSGLPVPVSVPGKKIQEREGLRHFPDRSRPFSSLDKPRLLGLI